MKTFNYLKSIFYLLSIRTDGVSEQLKRSLSIVKVIISSAKKDISIDQRFSWILALRC